MFSLKNKKKISLNYPQYSHLSGALISGVTGLLHNRIMRPNKQEYSDIPVSNSVDPDQTPSISAPGLGSPCLHMSPKRACHLKKINSKHLVVYCFYSTYSRLSIFRSRRDPLIYSVLDISDVQN